MKKDLAGLLLACVLISSCAPGQIFGSTPTPTPTDTAIPTIAPTSTLTSTSTRTATPTATMTLPATLTKIPSATPTPLPGLGVTPDEIVSSFSKFFTFGQIADIDGQHARRGVTTEGYSKITLVGSPYLVRAELRIDLSQENTMFATGYWILFLEDTSHGGKEAADWVHDNFPKATQSGKLQNTFGWARLTLESNRSGSFFLLIVEPVEHE